MHTSLFALLDVPAQTTANTQAEDTQIQDAAWDVLKAALAATVADYWTPIGLVGVSGRYLSFGSCYDFRFRSFDDGHAAAISEALFTLEHREWLSASFRELIQLIGRSSCASISSVLNQRATGMARSEVRRVRQKSWEGDPDADDRSLTLELLECFMSAAASGPPRTGLPPFARITRSVWAWPAIDLRHCFRQRLSSDRRPRELAIMECDIHT